MDFLLQPWQLLLALLADWVRRQQEQVIEYLRVENQVLKEKLGQRRLLLTDDQRRRLAVKGKILGHKRLGQVAVLAAPDTILRWYRELVPQKPSRRRPGRKRPGRPPLATSIRPLVVRMASENPRWGYDRICGAMANLGLKVSASSVGNILRAHGIEPSPCRQRQTTWATFLQAHWEVLASASCSTIADWLGKGLIVWQLLCGKPTAQRESGQRCLVAPSPIRIRPVSRVLDAAVNEFANRRPHVRPDREARSGQRHCRVVGEREVKPRWPCSRSVVANADEIRRKCAQPESGQVRARRAA
jgi:putative transposase